MIAVIVHLPLLADNARFWDGRLLAHLANHGHFRQVHTWFYEAGLQPQYWLHRILWFLPAPEWCHRLVSFISVFGIGAIVFERASRYGLDRVEAFALAGLVIVLPAYHVLLSIVSIAYVLPTFLFYLGWALYAEGRIEDRGLRFTVGGCALMFASYVHNSLLVFHYAFAFLACCLLVSRGRSIAGALRQLAPVLLLPVAFQIVKTLFLTPHGEYAGYNQLVVLDSRIPLGDRARLVEDGLFAFVRVPWLIALPFAALLVFWVLWRRGRLSALPARLALFGIVFYAAAVLPYLLVGKSPTDGLTWSDRFALQTALGLGLLIVAFARAAGELVSRHRVAIEAVVLGGAWLWCAARLESNYLGWMRRAARDGAVLTELRGLPAPPAGTAILWRDDIRIGDEPYRFYELSDIVNDAWGSERWIGIDARTEKLPEVEARMTRKTRTGYAAAQFQSNGCQAELAIKPGTRSTTGLAVPLRYFIGVLDPQEVATISLGPVTCAP